MPAPQAVRLLIKARWIVPVVPAGKVFEDCALAIQGNKILALLPQEEAEKRFHPEQTLNLDRHILTPGLINAHGHAAMSLLRGYADDHPLSTWLEEHIWPAEGRYVDADFVREGTELALAEMIRAGTTCYSDMYFFPEEAARAAQRAHMRAQITFPVLDFPTPWGEGPDDYIHKGLALHDQYRADDLVRVGFGPHAPYTLSDEPLSRIATLAPELDIPVHIHLHETEGEVTESLEKYGCRPSERLQKLGLLTPQTQCVHMTQVDETDRQILRDTGAHVIHCPESNLKLASGFCPVQQLIDDGINVALGTDGAASNNDLNLQSEMHTAALLAKAVARDASALSAHDALAMATLNGARALGMDSLTGSLEAGKAADIAAFEIDELAATPVFDPVSTLVYNSRATRATHVWVAGKALMLSGYLQTLNEREIITKARQWNSKMTRERNAWPDTDEA